MPRIVDHDERKREIAQSALTLFSKQGYYDSSFSDIASACRLSRSNIYNYFKNKDEIFHYAVVELLNSITQKIELIAHQEDLTLAQKLQRIYQLFTNDIEDGKNASIILDLSLRLKRKDTKLVATLENSAANLRKKIESLFASENSRLPYVQVAAATTLFFSLYRKQYYAFSFYRKSFYSAEYSFDSANARDMIVGEGFMLKENIEIPCRCIDKALLRTIERKRREI